MKLWKYVDSGYCHREAIVVLAETKDRAAELVRAHEGYDGSDAYLLDRLEEVDLSVEQVVVNDTQSWDPKE